MIWWNEEWNPVYVLNTCHAYHFVFRFTESSLSEEEVCHCLIQFVARASAHDGYPVTTAILPTFDRSSPWIMTFFWFRHKTHRFRLFWTFWVLCKTLAFSMDYGWIDVVRFKGEGQFSLNQRYKGVQWREGQKPKCQVGRRNRRKFGNTRVLLMSKTRKINIRSCTRER